LGRVFAQEVLEQCQEQGIDSHFEMVILAADRARRVRKLKSSDRILPDEEYMQGSTAVTALREIESGKLDMNEVKEEYLKSLSTVPADDQSIEEEDKD